MTSTRLCEQRYPTGKKDGKLTLLVKSKGTKWGRVHVMLGQGTSGEVKMVGRPKNEHSLPTKKQTNKVTLRLQIPCHTTGNTSKGVSHRGYRDVGDVAGAMGASGGATNLQIIMSPDATPLHLLFSPCTTSFFLSSQQLISRLCLSHSFCNISYSRDGPLHLAATAAADNLHSGMVNVLVGKGSGRTTVRVPSMPIMLE